jgi:hypothetical protein
MSRLTFRLTALAVVVSALSAGTARAGLITFQVQIDTSSFSGTAGSLEFQFNPASTSNGVTATISNFIGGTPGAVDNPLPNGGGVNPIGDVSGSLPGTITLDDGTPLNDLIQNFTYGTSFSFDVTFSSDLAGTGSDGSAFSLTLWNTPDGAFGLGNPEPLLPAPGFNPFGTALVINDGGPDGTGQEPTDPSVSVTPLVAAPEPASALLLALGAGSLLALRRRAS